MPKRRAKDDGSIYEDQDGYWWAQLPPGDDGKRPRRRRKTQREAQAAFKEMERERAAGVDLTIKQPTLWQWYQTWLETFAINLRPHIREDYASIGHCRIENASIGRRRLDRLTPVEVQHWVNALSIDDHLAPRTVRNARACLRTALEVALSHGYVSRNVAKGVKLPMIMNAEDAEIKPFTFQQVITFLDWLEGHRWYALYRLAVNLGPRQAEILGLTWDRIDLVNGELRIGQQIQRVADPTKEAPKPGQIAKKFVLLVPKTKSGERTLTLDDDLIAVLRQHKINQTEERLVSREWKDPYKARGGLVFVTETGAPIHGSDILQHFHRVLTKAGLPKIRFHDLRHTAATLMLADGVPLITVSKVLGHASPAITATIYAHALDESKASAVAGLSRRIRGG